MLALQDLSRVGVFFEDGYGVKQLSAEHLEAKEFLRLTAAAECELCDIRTRVETLANTVCDRGLRQQLYQLVRERDLWTWQQPRLALAAHQEKMQQIVLRLRGIVSACFADTPEIIGALSQKFSMAIQGKAFTSLQVASMLYGCLLLGDDTLFQKRLAELEHCAQADTYTNVLATRLPAHEGDTLLHLLARQNRSMQLLNLLASARQCERRFERYSPPDVEGISACLNALLVKNAGDEDVFDVICRLNYPLMLREVLAFIQQDANELTWQVITQRLTVLAKRTFDYTPEGFAELEKSLGLPHRYRLQMSGQPTMLSAMQVFLTDLAASGAEYGLDHRVDTTNLRQQSLEQWVVASPREEDDVTCAQDDVKSWQLQIWCQFMAERFETFLAKYRQSKVEKTATIVSPNAVSDALGAMHPNTMS